MVHGSVLFTYSNLKHKCFFALVIPQSSLSSVSSFSILILIRFLSLNRKYTALKYFHTENICISPKLDSRLYNIRQKLKGKSFFFCKEKIFVNTNQIKSNQTSEIFPIFIVLTSSRFTVINIRTLYDFLIGN